MKHFRTECEQKGIFVKTCLYHCLSKVLTNLQFISSIYVLNAYLIFIAFAIVASKELYNNVDRTLKIFTPFV